MPLRLEIVTPKARVYEDTVDAVTLPTTSGEIGILPHHIPLVTELKGGEITAQKPDGNVALAVSRGFVQCVGDKVSVLAEDAIDVEAIDEAEVEAARQRAEEALANATEMSQEELNHLETVVQFAKTQLLVRGKRR